MPDSFSANDVSKSASAVPVVPPSTSEVTIRTMASDIELMGKAGGMTGQSFATVAPQPESIRTTSFAPPPTAPQSAVRLGSMNKRTAEIIIWTGLIVIGGGILFAVGFYLIPALLK